MDQVGNKDLSVPRQPTADGPTRDVLSHAAPMPIGDRNQNPNDIGLLALLAEDFRTHDRSLFSSGFLAIALHRLANARMDIKPKLLRAPFSLLYWILFPFTSRLLGIYIPYVTRLGRRVRIWHYGSIWLGARAIGDDVHIRHNTTLGVLNRNELDAKPIIGNRVELGVGTCIMGAVTVGDDSVIGPNSVVIKSLPPKSVVMGVPARQAAMWKDGTLGG